MALRRPLVALVSLAACLALVSGGCSRGDGNTLKVVIAEYSKDHTKPFWQSLAGDYTKRTGVKVDLQVIDWNSIDQQVTTMIQNNQPPDVLNLNAFSSYARDGLLYAADEVLSPQTRADFLPAFAQGGEFRGTLYGLPVLASARAFFYNKQLFAGAGIEAPPRTWNQLVSAATRIRDSAPGLIGYALPLGPDGRYAIHDIDLAQVAHEVGLRAEPATPCSVVRERSRAFGEVFREDKLASGLRMRAGR